MKISWNKKYTTIAVYACIVITFAMVLAYAVLNFNHAKYIITKFLVIFNPFIYGIVVAFLVNPMMRFAENKIFKFIKNFTVKRIISMIAAFLVVIIIIALFIALLAPQIAESYMDLQTKLGAYASGAKNWVSDTFMDKESSPLPNWLLNVIDVDGLSERMNGIIADSYGVLLDVTPTIIEFVTNLFNQLKNALIGIIFSVYFLFSKEKLIAQCKKISYAFCSKRRAARIMRLCRITKVNFEGFIIGKIIDSMIIGILTFFVLMIFNIPYYPIVALIVGVTNVIPFFGPFIGAIPGVFIIFIASPIKALWFIVIIFIIQQLDGNVIGPKILGQTTNLSALGVMIAIILMSGLLGLTGMLIGVPLFAVIYALFFEAVDRKLIARGKKRNIEAYYNGGNGNVKDHPKNSSSKSDEEKEQED